MMSASSHKPDCLIFYRFPQQHWKRLRTSNVIERAFREVRRRTDVVGRFPGEMAALTLVWATLEQDRMKWRGGQTRPLVNAPEPPAGGFGVPYEFAPSGLEFSTPVTITIPHDADLAHPSTIRVYWYDPTTGLWSQSGISNVQHHVVSASVHSVSFQTTHFSAFGLGGSSGGGGGGGCAMSRNGEGDIFMLL